MKKLLFVIDSLHCGGSEKSLISLLSLLDYSKYSVDLQLFGYGGILEQLVPPQVNVLKPIEYWNFAALSLPTAIVNCLKVKKFTMLYARIKYSIKIRCCKLSNLKNQRIHWQCIKNVVKRNDECYDSAIAYAQGMPTFYVAEKVNAKKKVAWINISWKGESKEKCYLESFYEMYNKIIMVSHSAKVAFIKMFPQFNNKVEVIYDINNAALINDMAKMKIEHGDNFQGIKLLTIGRLVEEKGYDIAMEACKRLKERGLKFKWYVLGTGELKKHMETYIENNNIEDCFILLGVKLNPYPFIRNCDVYIQTSRTEGYGIAVAEARILNRPVVATSFDSIENQIKNGENGIVVDMTAEAVYEGIMQLLTDNALKEHIIENLQREEKGNVQEIEKFYNLIET